MIVAGNTLRACDALIFHSRFEHRTGFDLAYDAALHLLPRRLTFRVRVAAGGIEFLASFPQLNVGEQDIYSAFVHIDTDSISCF